MGIYEGFISNNQEPEDNSPFAPVSPPEQVPSHFGLSGFSEMATPELPFFRDKAMQGRHPNLYGVVGAATKTVLDMVPYGKYAFPENREIFNSLPPEDKAKVVAYDTMENLLFYVAAPAALKGLGIGARKVVEKLSTNKLRMVAPVEDAIETVVEKGGHWESFSYKNAVAKELKGKGFSEKEALGVAEAHLAEDPMKLTNFHREFVLREEPSAAFKKNISWNFTEGSKLSDEARSGLNFKQLQAKHWQGVYRKNFKGEGYDAQYVDKMFEELGRSRFDPEAMGKVSWGEITDKQTANLISQLYDEPREVRKLFKLASGKLLFPVIQPQRSVWGAGESAFQTNSKIYKPIVAAKEAASVADLNYNLMFAKMLGQRNFGEMKNVSGLPRFKLNKKLMTQANLDQAGEYLYKVTTLMDKLAVEKDVAKAEGIRSQVAEIFSTLDRQDGPVTHLFNIAHEYFDKLYPDNMRKKIPQVFHDAGLTEFGMSQIDSMVDKMDKKLIDLFSTSGARVYAEKLKFVNETMENFRSLLKMDKTGKNPLFIGGGKGKAQLELKTRLEKLKKELTTGQNGHFPGYLEGYAPKILARGRKLDSEMNVKLRGNIRGSHTFERDEFSTIKPMTDYLEMIRIRTSAQAKDLYLYPQLSRAAKEAESLPQVWRNQTDYLIGRMMNRPSNLDTWVATSLESTVGKLEAAFSSAPDAGLWNGARVQQLAGTIIDFTHMGYLGLKPFSALRNMFSPLITGAADIGGISDVPTIFRAMAMQWRPEIRKQVRDMGIITDLVPELSHTPIIPRGGVIEPVRDFTMWMFKQSEQFTRYTMGAAAMLKWSGAEKKVGAVTSENLGKFFSKAGINRRNPWVVAELEDLVMKGKVEEARTLFIKDVVADTQFLYGALDAPTAVNLGGATGKVAMTFQSWWMNYGSLINKWFRTAQGPGGKTESMITWMFSAAVSEQLMEVAWGREMSMQQVFLGPLPMDGPSMPPAFAAVFEAMKSIKATAELPFDGDMQALEQQYIRTLKKAGNFFPGGNMMQAVYSEYDKKGTPGIGRAILGMHHKKKESAIEKFLRKEF